MRHCDMFSYKLTYYPIQEFPEPIRFLFNYDLQKYIDKRPDRQAAWATIKSKTPYGQIPVIEVDGTKIAQSTTISRYFAKRYGLVGKNDGESLKIDMIVDIIHYIRVNIAAYHYEKNLTAKEEKLKHVKETVPILLKRLNARVEENDGYLFGGAPTWADFTFVALLDYLNYIMKEDIITMFQKYGNLQQLRQKIEKIPAIENLIV